MTMRDIVSDSDRLRRGGQPPSGDRTLVPAHRAPLLWRAAVRLGLIKQPAAAPADDPYIHIVGSLRLLERLGLAVPRARCGALQVVGPGQPDVDPDAPLCPACMQG